MSDMKRLSASDLARLLSGGAEEEPPETKRSLDVEKVALRDSHRKYLEVNAFLPGTLVRMKGGVGGYHNIGDNGVAIVHRMLPERITCEDVSLFGSPAWGTSFDMEIGYFGEGDSFMIARVDSRRFEPLKDQGTIA